jgi:hypothetical protein
MGSFSVAYKDVVVIAAIFWVVSYVVFSSKFSI